jgi:hypothetical protein
MTRRKIYPQKTQITATNFADASGSGANAARIPPKLLEPMGAGATEGLIFGRERSAGDRSLVAKERRPRGVAKLDCTVFFTPNTVGSRQVNNTGATSGAEVVNHVRNKNIPIQAAKTQKSQSRYNVANQNSFSRSTLIAQGSPLAKSTTLH